MVPVRGEQTASGRGEEEGGERRRLGLLLTDGAITVTASALIVATLRFLLDALDIAL